MKMTDNNVGEYLKFLQKNIDSFRLQQPDLLAQAAHQPTGSPKDARSQGLLQHCFPGEEDSRQRVAEEFNLNSENQKLLGEFLQKCEPNRWLYEESFEFEFLTQ